MLLLNLAAMTANVLGFSFKNLRRMILRFVNKDDIIEKARNLKFFNKKRRSRKEWEINSSFAFVLHFETERFI